METMNDTFPAVCDPCLAHPFQLYPVLLVLPAFFSIPTQSLVLYTGASLPLTEKTDVLTLSVIFVDFLLSVDTVAAAFTLKFLPVLYTYAWSAIIGLLGFGHPLFHSLVCLERYFAVEHPVVFLKYRPLRYRFAVSSVALGIVTFCSAFIMVICLIVFKVVLIIAACTFLSAVIMVNSFTCLSILRALLRPSPADKKLKSHNGSSRKDGNCIKRKAFFIISFVQISTILCYLPPILLFLYTDAQLCIVFLYNVWYIEITSGLFSLVYLHNVKRKKLN